MFGVCGGDDGVALAWSDTGRCRGRRIAIGCGRGMRRGIGGRIRVWCRR